MPDCLAFLVIEAFDPETAKAWMLGGCEIKTEEHYMATCDNVGGQSIFLFAISHGQFLLESLVDSSLEACIETSYCLVSSVPPSDLTYGFDFDGNLRLIVGRRANRRLKRAFYHGS